MKVLKIVLLNDIPEDIEQELMNRMAVVIDKELGGLGVGIDDLMVEDFYPEKDKVYWERNQLVRALSRIYPSWLGWHKEKDWEDDWRNIVYIKIPVRKRSPIGYGQDNIVDMQVSWHIHEDELEDFNHLKVGTEEWDGHDTEEKYRRLEALAVDDRAVEPPDEVSEEYSYNKLSVVEAIRRLLEYIR